MNVTPPEGLARPVALVTCFSILPFQLSLKLNVPVFKGAFQTTGMFHILLPVPPLLISL